MTNFLVEDNNWECRGIKSEELKVSLWWVSTFESEEWMWTFESGEWMIAWECEWRIVLLWNRASKGRVPHG